MAFFGGGASTGQLAQAAALRLKRASGQRDGRSAEDHIEDNSARSVYNLLGYHDLSKIALGLMADERIVAFFASGNNRRMLAQVIQRMNEDVWEEMRCQDDELKQTGIATLEQLRRALRSSSQVETWSKASVDAICKRVEDSADGEGGLRRAPLYQGRALREYLMQKGSLGGRRSARARAASLLEAVSVLQHADFMTASPDSRPVRTVLTGHPDSKREYVMLNALYALVESIDRSYQSHLRRCRIIAGSKGIGKTQILRCIGQAAAIVDFANLDMHIIPAFVSDAATMTPLSHMAVACLSHGVLLDEDGAVPIWAAPHQSISRGLAFVHWCRQNKVYPVLLIDDVTDYQESGVAFEMEAKRQLEAMAEYFNANGIVRLSGTWYETEAFVYGGIFKLHDEKLSIEPITAGMPVAEAAHMIACNSGDEGRHIPEAVTRLFAEQLLHRGWQTPTVEAAGFIIEDQASTEDPSPAKLGPASLMTREHALQWKQASPDWYEQVKAGEAMLMHAQHLSGSIPRYLAAAVGKNATASTYVLAALLEVYRSDPGARHLLRWLVGATQYALLAILGDPIEYFHLTWLSVHSSILDEAVDAHKKSKSSTVPDYTDGARLLESLAEAGIVQVRGKERPSPFDREGNQPRYVQFSSALFFSTAAYLSRGIEDLLHAKEMMAMQLQQGGVEGEQLVAEGIALHGLGQLVGTLRGTLACQVLDCDELCHASSGRGSSEDEGSDLSRQSRFPLARLLKGGEPVAVPINTVLGEGPDFGKCDRVAVCVAPGSKVAYVIRAQINLSRKKVKCLEDAIMLRDSWDKPTPVPGKADAFTSILHALKLASNLQTVEEWHHVPVLLSPTVLRDEDEIEAAGVRVIAGKGFWEFGIPHLRAVAWTLVAHQARTPDEAELRELISWKRPKPGECYMADVGLAGDAGACKHTSS